MTSLRHRTSRGRGPVLFAALLAAIQVSGCATSAPHQTRIMREQTGLEISAEELRIRVRSLAIPFSGMIEEAADALEQATAEPRLRTVGLRWKTNAIPAVQTSLFNPDPLAALLDTWALIAQLRLFLDQVPGEAATEEARSGALAALDRMESEIEQLVRSAANPGAVERTRDKVYAWAAANPIELTVSSRRSATTDLAALTAEARPGLRQAIGGLTMGMGDVWARLDAYSAYLPKQARWQAELLVSQVLGDEDVGEAFGDFSELTAALEEIAATVEQVPAVAAGEREAVLDALQRERIASFEALNGEFLAAVDRLLERRLQTAGEAIARERLALMTAVSGERVAVLDALHEERLGAMQDLGGVMGGLSEDAMRRLVDHAFTRAVELLGLLVLLSLVGAFVYVRVIRP
jgi:hypothetical protein